MRGNIAFPPDIFLVRMILTHVIYALSFFFLLNLWFGLFLPTIKIFENIILSKHLWGTVHLRLNVNCNCLFFKNKNILYIRFFQIINSLHHYFNGTFHLFYFVEWLKENIINHIYFLLEDGSWSPIVECMFISNMVVNKQTSENSW